MGEKQPGAVGESPLPLRHPQHFLPPWGAFSGSCYSSLGRQLQSPLPTLVSLLSSRPNTTTASGPSAGRPPGNSQVASKPTSVSLRSPPPIQPPHIPSESVTKPCQTLLPTGAPAQPCPPPPKPLGRSRLFSACLSRAPSSLPPVCPPKPLIRPRLPTSTLHLSPPFPTISLGPRSE